MPASANNEGCYGTTSSTLHFATIAMSYAYMMLKYTRLFIEVGLFMSPSPGRRREESVYTSGDARIHHHRFKNDFD